MSRVAIGAAHAYGNSAQVPYSEQFWVGGANSVRAFTVRSIGPGSYRAPKTARGDYFDQTGTFKFEANVEFRFPIAGPLHGAVFVDAGNVWLLKDDADRPGGKLRASTFLRDLALGTGVGLRFDLGMMVIRGDLGIGIHAPLRHRPTRLLQHDFLRPLPSPSTSPSATPSDPSFLFHPGDRFYPVVKIVSLQSVHKNTNRQTFLG